MFMTYDICRGCHVVLYSTVTLTKVEFFFEVKNSKILHYVALMSLIFGSSRGRHVGILGGKGIKVASCGMMFISDSMRIC
jgi:hypothetical protein